MSDPFWTRVCLITGLIAAAVAILAGWRMVALGGGGPIGPATTADQATARTMMIVAMLAGMAAGALLLGWLYLLDAGPRFWLGMVIALLALWVAAAAGAAAGIAAPASLFGRTLGAQAIAGLVLSLATAGIACVMPYRRLVPDAEAKEALREGSGALSVLGVLTLSGTTSAEDLEKSYGSNTFRFVAIFGATVMVFVYLFASDGLGAGSVPRPRVLVAAAVAHLGFLLWMNQRRRDWQASLAAAQRAP